MAAEQPGYYTNKPKGYIWLSSNCNFFNPSYAASPASSATYRTDLGLSLMPKYSKYTICLKQFQLDANNTAALGAVAAFTDLRDESSARVFSCAVCITGLPREKSTIAFPNDQAIAANAIMQTHLQNAFLLFDGSNSGNGYSSTERPTTPKFVDHEIDPGHRWNGPTPRATRTGSAQRSTQVVVEVERPRQVVEDRSLHDRITVG